MTDSSFVWFDGSTADPKPLGRARASGRRVAVRLDPHVEVDGDRVGVVQFGGDAQWVRSRFDEFILPPDATSSALVRVEDLQQMVRYCVQCDVEVTVAREFWNFSELLQ